MQKNGTPSTSRVKHEALSMVSSPKQNWTEGEKRAAAKLENSKMIVPVHALPLFGG